VVSTAHFVTQSYNNTLIIAEFYISAQIVMFNSSLFYFQLNKLDKTAEIVILL